MIEEFVQHFLYWNIKRSRLYCIFHTSWRRRQLFPRKTLHAKIVCTEKNIYKNCSLWTGETQFLASDKMNNISVIFPITILCTFSFVSPFRPLSSTTSKAVIALLVSISTVLKWTVSSTANWLHWSQWIQIRNI